MSVNKEYFSEIPFVEGGFAGLLEWAFEKNAEQKPLFGSLEELLCDEFVQISKDFDRTLLQESWSWRNTHVARELALRLINESGEIEKDILLTAINILESTLFSLGPERHHDLPRQQHLLKILKLFSLDPRYMQALKRIHKPVGNPGIDTLIRETLFLSEETKMTDAYARKATLSALLCILRQNVGSCFATAPAILIQQDQPLNFLSDITQLFGTGRLLRVFEGVEYVVPLSLNWGVGDLFRPILFSALGNTPFKLLASSPGLQKAFAAAGIIDHTLSLPSKKERCFELLKRIESIFALDEPFASINPNQIIKTVLLQYFALSEEEITHVHENRMSGPYVAMSAHISEVQSHKNLKHNRFVKCYESAKSAFKSLTDNALIKSWEFTLASLSESRAEFAKWNLYVSLGVQPEDPYGIGASLYRVLQEKMQQMNTEIEEMQSQYEHFFAQTKSLEGRMSRAASESEMNWLHTEYRMYQHEIHRLLTTREAIYDKGKRLQNLYPALIDFYGKKIREYFQEVYDAEMHDVSANPYDDSPAGFRLMYKYGRSNTALWTSINSASEYIQHLTSFFIATELDLIQYLSLEELQKEVSELITEAILTIKSPEFLEHSFIRLAHAYREPLIASPLQNIDKVKRKPWSYISGGAMSTLVSCYWNYSEKPQEKKRWVESEEELLAFLIDSMKELPARKKYEHDPEWNMLAFSPTHAFLCKPGWELFKKAWQSDLYTYTWIKEQWAAPHLKFLDSLLLDTKMMDALFRQFLHFIPKDYRSLVRLLLKDFSYQMHPSEFRNALLKKLSYEKWLQRGGAGSLLAEELDSILYRFLPIFSEYELIEKLRLLFENLQEIDSGLKNKITSFFPALEKQISKHRVLNAENLREIAKALIILATKSTRSSTFFHKHITKTLQKLGFCYPAPLLFADTNWVKNVFGFLVNPGTRNIEFWRFDVCGGGGRSMTQWKGYLNGSRKESWGIYSLPHQYGNGIYS